MAPHTEIPALTLGLLCLCLPGCHSPAPRSSPDSNLPDAASVSAPVPIAADTAAPVSAGQPLPARPELIEFQPLVFDPPAPESFRHVLQSGVPVYLATSHEFPLISVSFHFRGGEYLVGKAGLATMAGAMIRRGGTSSMPAETLDEELDYLAARCNTSSSSATLNCLESSFDRAFELFLDMLKNPAFQQDKVKVYRDQILEEMKQRNDEAGDILRREWKFLLYGENHHDGRVPTQASIESIDEQDLRDYHARVFQPGNLIISATGAFEEEEMLARLEQATAGWEAGQRMPEPPAPTHTLQPGLYHVEKDIPQGKVFLGMPSVTRDHPDFFPLLLMNNILGGGGFTSRITSRVRSKEGLAYSAGSSLSMLPYYPGEFRAYVQSKNRTVALAVQIILEEIDRIRSETVTEQELETARSTFIETFPRNFESKAGTLGVFVDDEWTGRPPGYWKTYRDQLRAVTTDDILRVAKQHLRAEEMAILVVGKWQEIGAGDLEGRASMSDLAGGRRIELKLRNPLTMEPLAQ